MAKKDSAPLYLLRLESGTAKMRSGIKHSDPMLVVNDRTWTIFDKLPRGVTTPGAGGIHVREVSDEQDAKDFIEAWEMTNAGQNDLEEARVARVAKKLALQLEGGKALPKPKKPVPDKSGPAKLTQILKDGDTVKGRKEAKTKEVKDKDKATAAKKKVAAAKRATAKRAKRAADKAAKAATKIAPSNGVETDPGAGASAPASGEAEA